MNVKELIELLQKMPQDTLVIHTFCSDYDEIEPDDITLMQEADAKDGEGLIRHHGHLMWLEKVWWRSGEKPEKPEFITAVHFKGN